MALAALLLCALGAAAGGAGDDTGDTCTASGTCGPPLAPGWAEHPEQVVEEASCREVLGVLTVAEAAAGGQSRPAVIADVPQAGSWDLEALGRERLRADFSSTRVKVFSPAQAALMAGQTDRRHSIRRLLPRLRSAEQSLYVFDPDFFKSDVAGALAPIPRKLWLEGGERLLTLGGPGSGTQFHAHGPAYLALLAGRKRWWLHPPGRLPNESAAALHRPMTAWAEEVLPQLGDGAPIACVQHPGETLFIPDSWSHATSNVGETVGVAWQRFTAATANCQLGQDYMCLTQSFASVPLHKREDQAGRYRDLWALADMITGGLPLGLLRYVGDYWKLSEDGERLFKRQRSRVAKLAKAARPNSDEAVLAAALTRQLADVLFSRGDVRGAAALLKPAVRKGPESGLAVILAQIYGKQGDWQAAVEQLDLHLSHFPDDENANAMVEQARGRAAARR